MVHMFAHAEIVLVVIVVAFAIFKLLKLTTELSMFLSAIVAL